MFWLCVCSEDDTIFNAKRVSLRRYEPLQYANTEAAFLFGYSSLLSSNAGSEALSGEITL